MSEPLLEIKNLSVSYGEGQAVSELSLTVAAGKTAAILGESGSGKSTVLKTIAGLLEPNVNIQGDIFYNSQSLFHMRSRDRKKLMGNEISMIFQNPESFLDPVKTIGSQMEEILLFHGYKTKVEAHRKAASLLESLSLAEPERTLSSYPFELSGGMCQRVSIAMASSSDRLRLILADEPTSALDQVVRAATADMIRKVCEKTGAALLLVTHDVRLAAGLAETIGIMHRGFLVEYGTKDDILNHAVHPYTKSLLDAVPERDTDFLSYERYRGDASESRKMQILSGTHWVLV